MSREALIVVDPQQDFCPGGALAVKGGDEIINPVNRLVKKFRDSDLPIFVSRDWHSANNTAHMGPGHWPLHCLQNTPGAEFHPDLDTRDAVIISKGMGNSDDGYSAFEGQSSGGQPLDTILRQSKISSLVICGLATDYCVKATVLDALSRDYSVRVCLDTIRAVDLKPEDGDKAVVAMCQAGAEIATSQDIIARLAK